MPDSTTMLSEILEAVRECLEENDLDAARFLRDGLRESVELGNAWLTSEELDLLDSF